VKDGERVLRSERHYGKLYRAFTLGQAVEENGAQAEVRGRRARADAAEEGGGPGEAHHDPVTPEQADGTAGPRGLPFFFALP
jgi:hypothetical protein